MTLRYIILTLIAFHLVASFSQSKKAPIDKQYIKKLNEQGFNVRLKDPNFSIELGKEALRAASSINDAVGIAEANRIIGIGFYYIDKSDSSMSYYLRSLNNYKQLNHIEGQARVYNNIGNLYRELDYSLGLKYFEKSLSLSKKVNLTDLAASAYVNIGIIYHRKKLYTKALANFENSLAIFKKQNNVVGIINSLQNKGVVYNAIKKTVVAEEHLLQAKSLASENDLVNNIASINLTLADIYIVRHDFFSAQKCIVEGEQLASKSKSQKLKDDYMLLSYKLHAEKKDYRKALFYLKEVYKIDSTAFRNVESEKIGLLETQYKFIEREKQNQLTIEKQKTNKVLLFSSIAIAALALILMVILYSHSQKTDRNNKVLKRLNEEVSLQKEELNKVNQNLEQIISERTKDLQIKNRKLSEYSSHLSHQIRGPISTMKGLMMLEKDDLMDIKEFTEEMGKCVNEIDHRIININEVLHDLSAPGLIPRPVDKETES